jgi:hypothetical protein
MKAKRTRKIAEREQGLLLNVARSIGSTLGSLAARTGAVPEQAARPTRAKKTKSRATKSRKKLV